MRPARKTISSYRSADSRRRRDLAIIHIAKKQLGMHDDAYRELLKGVAGVESAADLDEAGRRAVLKNLKVAGFYPVHWSARRSGMHLPASEEKAPLLSKIGAILADQKLPWSYADAIAKQAFSVQFVRWCDSWQLHRIVAILVECKVNKLEGGDQS